MNPMTAPARNAAYAPLWTLFFASAVVRRFASGATFTLMVPKKFFDLGAEREAASDRPLQAEGDEQEDQKTCGKYDSSGS